MPAATGSDVWAAAMTAGLDTKARHILLTLAGWAGLLGSIAMTERQLAALTGFSRSVVWGRLHRLEDAGWLQATRIRGQATIWTLLIPAGAPA